MEWRHSGSLRPKIIPSAKIRWKSSRLDFWDQDGILSIDYLPKGRTINYERRVLLISAGAIEGNFDRKTQREGHLGGHVLA